MWTKRIEALVISLLLLALSACASQTAGSAGATPTATVALNATATGAPSYGFTSYPVNFQVGPGVTASPNGVYIAGGMGPQTLGIYDVQGKLLGQYTAPQAPLTYAWLPDSSGLIAWHVNGSNQPDEAILIDRNGASRPSGLTCSDPVGSPDGQWIACGAVDPTTLDEVAVQVVPRNGGVARIVAHTPNRLYFLGWVNDQVVYAIDGTFYAAPASGGPNVTLGKETTLDTPTFIPDWANTSPDGSVLVISTIHGSSYLATGSRAILETLPTMMDTPVFWIGPHTALGLQTPQNMFLRCDLAQVTTQLTGASAPDTYVSSVSGNWVIAGISVPHLINLQTKASMTLSNLPVAGQRPYFVSLHNGKFLFLANGGPTYLFDPASYAS